MDTTTTTINVALDYTISDYYIVAALASAFGFICIFISLIIVILIRRKKARLHTVNHLLVCNTCLASIFYCVVVINNFIFLIFIQWETSDISCRWRAYFAYAGIAGVIHSYMIQAISRFFICVLPVRYRWLTTFQAHYILITIQWFVVFLIVLPTIITKDIHFIPAFLCWIPGQCLLHIIYAYIAYYGIPVVVIISIYIYIFYRIIKIKRNSTIIINYLNSQKRDLELLRNIVLLLCIYLAGGIPTIVITRIPESKTLHLASFVTQTLAVAFANLFTIVLNRELRLVIKRMICRTTRVVPLNNAGQIQQNLQNKRQMNNRFLQTCA